MNKMKNAIKGFKVIHKWDWKYIIKWTIVIVLFVAWGLWMSYNIGAQL